MRNSTAEPGSRRETNSATHTNAIRRLGQSKSNFSVRSLNKQLPPLPSMPTKETTDNNNERPPKVKRISALPPKSKRFTEFLKANKEKAVIHPKNSLRSLNEHTQSFRDGDRLLMRNKLNSRAVSAGDWQTFLSDKKLTAD